MMQIECLIWNLADTHTQCNGSEGGGAGGDYLEDKDGGRWQGQYKKAA